MQSLEKQEQAGIIMFICIVLSGLLILYCANKYPFARLVNAIYYAAGAEKSTYLYGIKSVSYKNKGDARRICFNTVKNTYKRWEKSGKKGDFVDFLAQRYCPENPKQWAKNVRYFIKKN